MCAGDVIPQASSLEQLLFHPGHHVVCELLSQGIERTEHQQKVFSVDVPVPIVVVPVKDAAHALVWVLAAHCCQAHKELVETDQTVGVGIVKGKHAVVYQLGGWQRAASTTCGASGHEAAVEGITIDGDANAVRVLGPVDGGQALELIP